MEEIGGVNNTMNQTIVLFDDYEMGSQNLHTSLLLAGYDFPVVVIEDDGFLPSEVCSVYESYLGDYANAPGSMGKPRYFNQITVPDYWEISRDNRSGKIQDMNYTRGHIHYMEPKNKRLVKQVDWLDEKGVIRSSDHYNQYGFLFARTSYNNEGKRIVKTFFSATGKDVITENYATGDIMLQANGVLHIFHSKTEFVLNFFRDKGWENGRILFNSLSTPFFVSERLPQNGMQDILFWQEGPRPDVPGNMQIILDGRAARTEKIVVQKRRSYNRFLELGVSEDKIQPLGFIYPFMKTNEHVAEALICTNSDQVEQLETLVKALPQMRFHVAAITEMSQKLMRMGNYENVHLYPAAKESTFDTLFEKCDFYLDINHANEILNAVSEAFLYNQLIFGFSNTIHNWDYVAQEHIYQTSETNKLIEELAACIEDFDLMEDHLYIQQQFAMAEEEYSFLQEQKE